MKRAYHKEFIEKNYELLKEIYPMLVKMFGSGAKD